MGGVLCSALPSARKVRSRCPCSDATCSNEAALVEFLARKVRDTDSFSIGQSCCWDYKPF